jgi:hypothetical protein
VSGTPENARQWAEADVYVSFDLEAALPATINDPFDSDWELAGLLDGDAGFVESRNEDMTDFFAWGGLLIRTARRNFILTRTFTSLEASSPVIDRLRYPGSTDDEIVVPSGNRIEQVKVAFETVDRDITRRVITRNYAEVTVDGDVTESEQALSSIPFVVKVFPDGDGVLFDRQTDEVLSS